MSLGNEISESVDKVVRVRGEGAMMDIVNAMR